MYVRLPPNKFGSLCLRNNNKTQRIISYRHGKRFINFCLVDVLSELRTKIVVIDNVDGDCGAGSPGRCSTILYRWQEKKWRKYIWATCSIDIDTNQWNLLIWFWYTWNLGFSHATLWQSWCFLSRTLWDSNWNSILVENDQERLQHENGKKEMESECRGVVCRIEDSCVRLWPLLDPSLFLCNLELFGCSCSILTVTIGRKPTRNHFRKVYPS